MSTAVSDLYFFSKDLLRFTCLQPVLSYHLIFSTMGRILGLWCFIYFSSTFKAFISLDLSVV